MPFGLSAIGIGKSLLGGIFGKRSVYNFVPGHPPGAFRGAAALADYNRRMQALGLNTRGGTAPNVVAKNPGLLDQVSSAVLTMIKPAVVSSLSPVMPGGAVIQTGGAINRGTRKKKKRSARARTTRRARSRRRGRRGLTAAQLRAGFGGKRRMRRRKRAA